MADTLTRRLVNCARIPMVSADDRRGYLFLLRRLITIPDNQDCRQLSPVFFGYDLVKKPRSRAGALPDDEVPLREDFVTHRKGKPCPVCLVGKPGSLLLLLLLLLSLLLMMIVWFALNVILPQRHSFVGS